MFFRMAEGLAIRQADDPAWAARRSSTCSPSSPWAASTGCGGSQALIGSVARPDGATPRKTRRRRVRARAGDGPRRGRRRRGRTRRPCRRAGWATWGPSRSSWPRTRDWPTRRGAGPRGRLVVGDMDSVEAEVLDAAARGRGRRSTATPRPRTPPTSTSPSRQRWPSIPRRIVVVTGEGDRFDHALAVALTVSAPRLAGVAVEAWMGPAHLWVVRERQRLAGPARAIGEPAAGARPGPRGDDHRAALPAGRRGPRGRHQPGA